MGIDYAEDNDISLIIALDCGIKSIDHVNYANAKNIDFIRTSVEENTSGVQEVARAVGSITNQATHLNHVAEQFILEDDSNSARLNVDAPNALKRLRG
jgi:hypothetical protein